MRMIYLFCCPHLAPLERIEVLLGSELPKPLESLCSEKCFYIISFERSKPTSSYFFLIQFLARPERIEFQNNLSKLSTDNIDIILCPLLVYSEFEQAKS